MLGIDRDKHRRVMTMTGSDLQTQLLLASGGVICMHPTHPLVLGNEFVEAGQVPEIFCQKLVDLSHPQMTMPREGEAW